MDSEIAEICPSFQGSSRGDPYCTWAHCAWQPCTVLCEAPEWQRLPTKAPLAGWYTDNRASADWRPVPDVVPPQLKQPTLHGDNLEVETYLLLLSLGGLDYPKAYLVILVPFHRIWF